MSKLPKAKFRGTQGSWLISANIPGHGDIKLPSAHKRFLMGMHYSRDDGLMVQVAPGKYKEWREALLKYIVDGAYVRFGSCKRTCAAQKLTSVKCQ